MMRTSILLKAAMAVAALGMAHQAQAQTASSGFTMYPVQPLIGDAPRPLMTPGATMRIAVQPAGDPAAWVGASDYPAAALAEAAKGQVVFRVEVDESGLVIGCRVTKSSGFKALDKETCNLVRRRARFLPGRNSDNEPAGGVWSGSVNWDLPPSGAAS